MCICKFAHIYQSCSPHNNHLHLLFYARRIEDGLVKSKIRHHHKSSSIRKVRFNNEGHMVTIAKTVKVHDLDSNKTSHTLKRDDGKKVQFYSVKPFGHDIICAGDDDGGIFVWDTRTPEEPIFSAYDCEQYISDIDGKFETRRQMLCTSGEGTLTAYDLRAKKMIEPQSELFEAGFQCMKLDDDNKKVVIGGEDGALYVFNQNEWAHTSGKFAISSDLQNRGRCSIDCIDTIPESSIFLVGCSDGKMRSIRLWPHQVMSEKTLCKKSSLESIHVNPKSDQSRIVISGENFLNIVSYRETSDDESEAGSEKNDNSIEVDESAPNDDMGGSLGPAESRRKELKTDTEDYLNVFN